MGIVGKNGTGKTTFLKMLLGSEPLDKGKIVVGETVVFGHFSQDLIKVNDDFKVIDVVKEVAEFIPLEKGKQLSAAQLLERFLFPRSMHYNFVRKLSGGEKRRLKLLRVLMGNPNFLILDEPTNDLDIFAMAVLEEYLRNFKGCLIVVSHDRYFMDKMVDHLLVFQGGGEVKDILGNYTDFRKNEKEAQKEKKSVNPIKKTEVKQNSTEQKKTKLSFKEKEEFNRLERDLEQLEQEKSELSKGLSDESRSNADLYEMGKRLGEVVQQIDQKTDRWMELAEYV
jgi:ATP-binding cassette subfamily F protein uup